MSDLLAGSKALLELDAANALVPHGLGGHGRKCLAWCVGEIERLRDELAQLQDGRRAILPTSRKHALDLLTVAEAGVKQFQT